MKLADIYKIMEDTFSVLGLQKGDNVFVTANLSKLSFQVMQDVSGILERVLKSILGEEGTIMVQTYTTYVTRYGKPFMHETSRCTSGAFSQRILENKDSIRSLHPINSFTALGKNSIYLCKINTCNNYGLGSPLDKLLSLDGKVLKIGIPIGSSPLMHYAESVFGVPYNYNKLLDVCVYQNGNKLSNTFSANVRYLHLNVEYDKENLDKIFYNKFFKNEIEMLDMNCSMISGKDIVTTYLEMLSNDVWSFLTRKPEFAKGTIPYDGFTSGRDGVS